MQYEVKLLPKSTVKLTIEVPAEELKNHKEKAAEDISKDVKIPGFRPGKAPLNVLEQHVDPKHILAHAFEIATQYSYAEAVTKEKLRVISRPKINFISDTTKADEPLKFEAEVAVLPKIEVKNHKEISVKKEEVKVTEKEIEDVIEDLKKHFTDWKDVDRPVKKGDRVELDFEGFEPDKDGKADKALENTASKNHPIVMGDNVMVPGFEDNLLGLKKDEKKEFELTFPKEYHKKDFQNKRVIFKVELKRIEEGVKPELNEELIEKLTGQKMSIEEFRKDVDKNIRAQKEQKAIQERENKYLEELLKRVEVELPDSLIEEEIDFIMQDMQQDLAQKGVPFEKFLEQTKMDLTKLREKYREEAERRIKTRMALMQVIEEEKVEITDKELEDEITKMIEFYPEDQRTQVREELTKDDGKFKLKNKLLLRKFFDKVLG
ncbi:trigger factor [Candidatus Peregrinibacteria bacterium]|nr:trigger factor [Candidatus Peregrinibacteria bacterium]